MNSTRTSDKAVWTRFAWVALTAIAVLLFMGKSYERSLQALDSAIHARLALDVTSGGWKPVLPMRSTLTGRAGFNHEPFNDHPFVQFYLVGSIMRFFGATAWSARILPSLFGVGCVLLTAELGTLLFSSTVGLAAGFILAWTQPFLSYAARFQLDPGMVFFILLSFIAWWKRRGALMGFAAGIGLWMKSPVAFLIFPAAFLTLLLTKKLIERKCFFSFAEQQSL